MGGSEQPFLYPSTPTSHRRTAEYPASNFNPRAATQASYQALQERNRPRSRPDGPLIKLDAPERPMLSSYMVVSGSDVSFTPKALHELETKRQSGGDGSVAGSDRWTMVAGHHVSYEPMPANTKTKVKALRWIQFSLRTVEELGAMGILVCMVCLRNMSNVFSWIMRIAPAWDIIVTLYALYHLFRPATARTPASSASYHTFAVVMDIGLLPFYVYICLYAHNNYVDPIKDENRWTSVFNNVNTTNTMLFATFIGAAAVGGLHLISACFDLWLIVIFKKIAHLPPDVNPLEDNLTSRVSRGSKHKYKNSEVTLTGDSWSEKKAGFYSGSTLNVDQAGRLSALSKDVDEARSNRIPLNHSRVKSDQMFSSNTISNALASQEHYAGYKSADMDSPYASDHQHSLSPNHAIPWPARSQEHPSRPNSSSAMLRNDFDRTDAARMSPSPVPSAGPPQIQLNIPEKENLMTDNWYVIDDDELTLADAAAADHLHIIHDDMIPQPLKMNPPTPPPKDDHEYPDAEDDTPSMPMIKRKPLTPRADNGNANGFINPTTSNLDRKSTVQSHVTFTSSVYSDDEDAATAAAANTTTTNTQQQEYADVRSTTPKRKYYGDLAAATRGVLGHAGRHNKAPATTATSKSHFEAQRNRILSNETVKSTGTVDAAAMDATGMSALGGYGYGRVPSRGYTKAKARERVVSSGVDVVDMAMQDQGAGMRMRRDVSGKVAEEGRGGAWWGRRWG